MNIYSLVKYAVEVISNVDYKRNVLTKPEHGENGYLDIDLKRLSVSAKVDMEPWTKDANKVTSLASSSSDLMLEDPKISGTKSTCISACSLANLTPSSQFPWYRAEANAQITTAS